MGLLRGLRVIEGSAFVAAPLAGMTLAQMGADVIRFDALQGGLDARRWPVTREGRSLYWAGLNKGKRSLAVDLRTPEGRELVAGLICLPGPDCGLFLTNLATSGPLGYEALKARRPDVVVLNLIGNPDGSTAVDFTVNSAVGIPFATGPERAGGTAPVNNALPAWDLTAGMMAALGLLAAERHRRLSGEGQLVRLSLADVAFAMVGALGYVGDAAINGADRPATGNYLYGAFGSEFATRDGRMVYVVAITERMWSELVKATGMAEAMAALATARGLDLARNEGARFAARAEIRSAMAPWFAARTLGEIAAAFAPTGVCWGPYRTTTEMLAQDARVAKNPMFAEIEQPGIGAYPVPGLALQFSASGRDAPRRAPILGEHTDEILETVLGLSAGEIGKLRDKGVVGGPIDLAKVD